jgi:hypothetical protein
VPYAIKGKLATLHMAESLYRDSKPHEFQEQTAIETISLVQDIS